MSVKPSKLTLFRGWPERGCYVWSPFVTKLELRLRMGGVPYYVQAGSPTKAPNGKIPYVDLGPLLDGETEKHVYQGDSALIVTRLVQMGCLSQLNGSLSAQERVLDAGICALMEDRLYFYHTRERWCDNYYTHRDKILWSIPLPLRVLVGFLIHRKVNQMLHAQDVGRYSSAEIQTFKREIWQNINSLLESSIQRHKTSDPFWCLGGTEPTEADTTLYGFVVSVLVAKRLTGTACSPSAVTGQYPLTYGADAAVLSNMECGQIAFGGCVEAGGNATSR